MPSRDLDWSILIPSIPSRVRTAPDLFEVLLHQIQDRLIEVLMLTDNKRRTVGEKRDALLSLAEGRFVSFIDDDDLPAPTYVERIHEAILANPRADVIVYDHLCSIDGRQPFLCKYGIEYEYAQSEKLWTGKPAHTQTWATALAQQVPFPSLNVGEDVEWVLTACQRVTTQIRIPEVLYFYNCRTDRSETRGDGLVRDVPAAYRDWWNAARRVG